MNRAPWTWVPSLYLAQGVPYVLVVTVSTSVLKRLGVENAEIAFWTSWLYLPWVIKPLWSPFVELVGTRRQWVLATQAGLGVALGLVAVALPTPLWLQLTLAMLWVTAFASATHDIAADGVYLLGLDTKQQAAFVGVRSTFYRIAMVLCEGPLVMLAGFLETRVAPSLAWAAVFAVAALGFAVAFVLHRALLPASPEDVGRGAPTLRGLLDGTRTIVADFAQKPAFVGAVAFLLLYRLAEAQLVKMIAPFLLDPRDAGGLALTTAEVGLVKGTFGVVALLVGGVLGGVVIARHGLRRWLLPMAFIMHVPDLVFVALAWAQPESRWIIGAAVAAEQLGYGFGFTAYTMFLVQLASGPHRTSHYAIGTGVMALGMMVPGMVAGQIQEALGYLGFFVWVLVATLPGFVVAAWAARSPIVTGSAP